MEDKLETSGVNPGRDGDHGIGILDSRGEPDNQENLELVEVIIDMLFYA